MKNICHLRINERKWTPHKLWGVLVRNIVICRTPLYSEEEWAGQMVKEFDPELERFHNDSTTLTLHGEYRDADGHGERGKPILVITFGYNNYVVNHISGLGSARCVWWPTAG